jgi:niacin transporter
MMSRIATSPLHPLPLILKYTDVRSYVLTFTFVVLSVLVPWSCHQFHLAGATFLPMHLFVLIAGLVFGWRTGLIVGLLTPLASYLVSGMPALTVLPQIVVEVTTYGIVAGLLRQNLRLRPIWALLGAMAAGRLALFTFVGIMYLTLGTSYSPLGAEANPAAAVWATVRQGWPGVVIQLALIPVIVWLLGKLAPKTAWGRQP